MTGKVALTVSMFAVVTIALGASVATAQPPGPPQSGLGPPPVLPGPPPTHANIDYAPAEPADNGHKLDLYIPAESSTKPLPVVIWTGGSAWMSDTGKRTAPGLAAQLLPAGYAVAGVSIRSTSQVTFPGQLHDIKAAIRWLRANAVRYHLIPRTSPSWATAPAGGPRRWPRSPVTRPRWKARWASRASQRGAGRRGVLPPDQFRGHGCLGRFRSAIRSAATTPRRPPNRVSWGVPSNAVPTR